jgi:Fe-Mn family superoxide dismutase
MLQQVGLGAAALALSGWTVHAADPSGYSLADLPYPPDALEPHIDRQTMEIHHGRHHRAYVDNLNRALADQPPTLRNQRIESLLRQINQVPAEIRQAVINNGGGHANHTLFWQIMGPRGGGEPGGPLGRAVTEAFGSFAKFQEALTQAAITRFGSGWSWLVVDRDRRLHVVSTANQDSPLMAGQTPILGLDVWEHAYYLRYQNRRADYVRAWWNVVNWQAVAARHETALKG